MIRKFPLCSLVHLHYPEELNILLGRGRSKLLNASPRPKAFLGSVHLTKEKGIDGENLGCGSRTDASEVRSWVEHLSFQESRGI